MKYILLTIAGIILMAIAAVMMAIEINLTICLSISITGWIVMARSLDKYLYPPKNQDNEVCS